MVTIPAPAVRPRQLRVDGGTLAVLAGGAVAFNIGGALHPNDNGDGNKVAQLHDMLLQSTWYPSHVGLLSSFFLFTVAFMRLNGRLVFAPLTQRLVRLMFVVSAATTAAMVPHLLAPLSADSIADGHPHPLSVFMTVDETLADAPWALGVALLALVAGAANELGNRVTAVLGMTGGVCFAAAAISIPFTDALDSLFAVGGVGITLWALGVVAVCAWRRRQVSLLEPGGRPT
jgi:hypothetical protein